MKRITFRQAIKEFGYEVVKYTRGYNFRSAFATKMGDDSGQLYYFHIEDLREDKPMVYFREAKSLTDYTGGYNHFEMRDKLAERGFEIYEPRTKQDFNQG